MRACKTMLLACLLLSGIRVSCQLHAFTHLNTSDGLSENNVKSVCIDRNGLLWVGTIDGLNVYDGYSVTVFRKEEHPNMASNNVIHLTCDSHNQVWMGTSEGISWIDDNRNLHRVFLDDSISRFGCRTIQDTKNLGVVLYTSLGQYYFNQSEKKWKRLDWIPHFLRYERFHDAEPFDENRIIYATDSLVAIVDYAKQSIDYIQPFKGVFSLCRYSDHELAIGLQQGLVLIADIREKKINRQYQLTSELNKKRINSTITELRRAVNGQLMVGTAHAGLSLIDSTGKITQFQHDPIDPNSIGSNLTWRVLSGANGDIIVGTGNAGVSMFNIYNRQAGYINLFNDNQGHFYDSYVSEMEEDRNGILWIGALERLIRWDRKNNQVRFFYYYAPPITSGAQNLEIRALCIDRKGRVWISALGDGIAILDESTGQFRKLRRDTSMGPAVKSDFITDLYTAGDGTIWAGSVGGVYTIDPATLKIHPYTTHPLLKELNGIRVNAFLEDAQKNMWMATHNGIYVYHPASQVLDHYTRKEGLTSNQCFTLYQDREGNVYTGTHNGLNIISGGIIKSFTRENGLKYSYCEGVLQDDAGKIWIANTKCLVRLDPKTGSLQYFDENAGLTTEGFRMASAVHSKTGELLWGSRSGINYFFPDQLLNRATAIRVNIYQVETKDSSAYFSGDKNLSLNFLDNTVIFRFAAVNLRGAHNIQYQYKLEGLDTKWQSGRDTREARYSSLTPGSYLFKARASLDGVHWVEAANTVSLEIIPPIWQRWWFITIWVLALAFGFYLLVYFRSKKEQRQKEELETEQAINYFASSMYGQHTVEMILWDVAKNCIGRLQFEDCVIYLFDKKKQVLVQKAAHGPKSPRQFEIDNPIEIPLGKGIVGSVAASGRPELIADTSRDPRYIVDDEMRYAEISVPIMYDGEVLGVIDCEHSKKGFFTQKHLSILTTIASLCANKIVRAKAEEEKEHAQLVLMNTQRKMTEVEMQALRAQMNPHFIFNCLNSINRYIVKSDQATASFYLTKFAKLIRLILDNSNTKNVLLSHELEALKLYIEMESLRFDKKFSYRIQVEPGVHTDCIEVPPLIIQPYVENAIWHGLLHKESPGNLFIHVSMADEGMLECVIEDDGVGREKAKEMKSKSATTRKSLGLKLTENRLALLNKYAELNASIDIIDLKKTDMESGGTRVILKIPI